MSLEVTADDFGLCEEINGAVRSLYEKGVLSRVSLVVNTPLFETCVRELRGMPSLAVGVHLNLTDGAPVLPPEHVGTLVGPDGRFWGGRHVGVAFRLASGRMDAGQVQAEWTAQVRKAVNAGLSVTHLNSHGHLHLWPALHGVVARLAREFSVPEVRSVSGAGSFKGMIYGMLGGQLRSRLRSQGAGSGEARRTLGIGLEGRLTRETVLRELERVPEEGGADLIVHPALEGSAYHRSWGWKSDSDLKALSDVDVIARIKAIRAG